MAVRLNHTIVASHDKEKAALFLAEILGLPAPSLLGPFAVVRVSDDTSLDYMDADGEITSQHYAFLVSEIEFDEIFARIRERRLRTGPTPGVRNATRLTAGTTAADSTSTTRTATCWRSSPVRTAAAGRRHPTLTPWSRRHWIPKITRTATLINQRRAAGEDLPLPSGRMRDKQQTKDKTATADELRSKYDLKNLSHRHRPQMTRVELIIEVKKLRRGIRVHRASSNGGGNAHSNTAPVQNAGRAAVVSSNAAQN